MKNIARIGIGAAAMFLAAVTSASAEPESRRSGYSYVRQTVGEVTVISGYNGRVAARRNLPITAGDEIQTAEGGRAEIALADGNLLHVGGGTRARFVSLASQAGEEDELSAIKLTDGSLILSAVGADENALPRVDTEDATIYLSARSRVRVNADPRRGTVVIARSGTVEVRTPEKEYTLRAGQYMLARGEEEPEIERGSFSRDRFDVWAADRLSELYETRSASARYVDDEYDSDVVALDGYGDWSYNNTYSTNVWTPRVSAGWTPYSYGSWYYTPIGLSWWSYDPWGWYPHHYGSWFYDNSRWCWAPSYVYSPAWVYWGYTPSYVGWCPIGYYSFYSPWWDTYYRRWGIHGRGGVAFSIHGNFSTRSVDFHGWNFVGAGNFSSVARMDVIPGSRIASRIGPDVAISSRPLVVNARGRGTKDAIQEFVRAAPRVIQRDASPDSSSLAPVLARQRTLPPATANALRGRTVVAERGRLVGPGAEGVAPRGAILERGRTLDEIAREPRAPRAEAKSGERGRDRIEARAPEGDREVPRNESDEGWRGRSREVPRAESSEHGEAPAPREIERAPREREAPPARPERSEENWRGRSRAVPAPKANAPREAEPPSSRNQVDGDWRSRSDVPPARRVIEGALPGRRSPESRPETAPLREAPPAREVRSYEAPRSRENAPREYSAPREQQREGPRPSREGPRPQRDSPRSIERSAPPPQAHSAPPPPSSKANHGRGRHKN